MNKKRILVIHGLGGGETSKICTVIKEVVTECDVYGPEIPQNPDEAMALIRSYEDISLIVGVSLGGFYALCSRPDVPKIIINPAIHPREQLVEKIGYGEHDYLKPRYDGAGTFWIDEPFIDALGRLEDELYEKTSDGFSRESMGISQDEFARKSGNQPDGMQLEGIGEWGEEYFGMVDCVVACEDELLGEENMINCQRLFDNITTMSGGHVISRENIINVIVPLIRKKLGDEYE